MNSMTINKKDYHSESSRYAGDEQKDDFTHYLTAATLAFLSGATPYEIRTKLKECGLSSKEVKTLVEYSLLSATHEEWVTYFMKYPATTGPLSFSVLFITLLVTVVVGYFSVRFFPTPQLPRIILGIPGLLMGGLTFKIAVRGASAIRRHYFRSLSFIDQVEYAKRTIDQKAGADELQPVFRKDTITKNATAQEIRGYFSIDRGCLWEIWKFFLIMFFGVLGSLIIFLWIGLQ